MRPQQAMKAASPRQGAMWWVRDRDLLSTSCRESGYLFCGICRERERGEGRRIERKRQRQREKKRNRKRSGEGERWGQGRSA